MGLRQFYIRVVARTCYARLMRPESVNKARPLNDVIKTWFKPRYTKSSPSYSLLTYF